jgi:DnaJ-class molecular chaperone
MRDPYDILGIDRNADKTDIKKAYRRLAKTYHPDSNSSDPKAAQRFSNITQAYDFLNDGEKRRAFDSDEIDADGNPRRFAYNRNSGRAGGFQGDGQQFGGFSPDDIFSDLFSGFRGNAQQTPFSAPEVETNLTMSLSLQDAASGVKRRLSLSNGRTVEVSIPKGVQSGQVIRLRGQGNPSRRGIASDLLITVNVETDSLFERDGMNLRLTLPISLYEAVLGAKVRIPTLEGSVELNIPGSSSSGKVLRLKSKGIKNEKELAGDLFVILKIILPPADLELETFLRKRSITEPYSVRGTEFD